MNRAVEFEEDNDRLFCRKLARVVSSTGYPNFADQLFELIQDLVPIHGLELSEWTLDIPSATIREISILGTAGIARERARCAALDQGLLPSILHMNDPLLIQRRLPSSKLHPLCPVHQCNLVAGNGNLRRIICFYRQSSLRTFTLPEMSALKTFSETLLFLLEHHSRSLGRVRQSAAKQNNHAGSVDNAFCKKLEWQGVPLSAREREVCVGLLSGITVPELARRLEVKNSSIESYLKRAASKLGVRGRHGLARWMANS
ncbi:DNA-binding CsgD family transcriptional regulator [Pseudomonas sp. BIGb0408]|uniref:DNA-binding CsgD family transcriptional regulator n=1 Tax=Phytopseudomonas flavescens TaxID=29435 RepID=A0A7Y9XMQ2_9GAMM|nr:MULTISPECIES: helix-turn-helix transcriptional regulator [Pseudomonas]MCW2292440.1 DNA-binding CsgD family transcriptional regulator [Pseudomonas sp. BIGb0408]NYH72989.1 DNA-binding CsgD family transcriptional regulator [Pseudomonas flavescens]